MITRLTLSLIAFFMLLPQTQNFSGGSGSTLTPSSINNIQYVDGVTNKTIQAAITALGSAGGAIIVPAGTYVPTAQMTEAAPICMEGAGMDITIVKPSAALASTLFNVTGQGYGYCFRDMTIDMTNASSKDAVDWNPTTNLIQNPDMNHLRFIYPASSTGEAIYMTNTGFSSFENIFFSQPGVCIYIQGDGTAENTFSDLSCDSPNGPAYEIVRTTTTDVGAYYFKNVRATNGKANSTAAGFVLTGTTGGINGGSPFWCTACVSDGQTGGPSFSATNWVNLFIGGDSWFTNSAASGSNYAAISLNNVNECHVDGGQETSLSRDMVLVNTVENCTLANMFLDGTNTNFYAASATLTDIRFSPKRMAASTPMSQADQASITAAAVLNAPFANAMTVWVSGSQGLNQSFQLCDKDASTNFCYGARVNGGQVYQILNPSGGQALGVNTTGAVNINVYTVSTLPSASTAGAGAALMVSDASSFVPGTCTGSGSDYVLAISNGSTWSCH